jgi:AcrR family transcriptional regulator
MRSKPAGRPREFDYDAALDQAVNVFWSKGYEGTSVSDLTRATGINRPSLYAAFVDKESLFRRAMKRYVSRQGDYFEQALSEPDVRTAMNRLLDSVINAMTERGAPHGCLLVHGALVGGHSIINLQSESAALRSKGESAIRKRLERAKAEGELHAGAEPRVLARYFATFINGLAVQAAGGTPRRKLRALKDWIILALPTRDRQPISDRPPHSAPGE